MKQRLLIIGAGGHARVVAETALLEEKYELVGFIDDYVAIGTVILRDYKVLAALQNIDRLEFDVFIVAVGKNSVRKNIYDFLKQKYEPALVIHPQSVISPFAHIAKGCVVLA
ncbi:MAG: lipid carrier--UDP-N-acetylgalactosaminyltransferase, partial [Sphingobacteriia bacterium]|nr:lipid carrier--UDP-N-acetylgalactosaminyltransferase [Sphingobacteriia bacterium]